MKVYSLNASFKLLKNTTNTPQSDLKQGNFHITTRSERAKELMQHPHIVHTTHKNPLLPKIFFFF